MAGYSRPLTAEDRAKRDAARQDKVQQLQRVVAQQKAALRQGRGADWAGWLRQAARFHAYSLDNVHLIQAQRPASTLLAGYEAWQALGRQVVKGEKGVQLLGPPAASGVTAPRLAYLWDVSQTSGEPLPPAHRPPERRPDRIQLIERLIAARQDELARIRQSLEDGTSAPSLDDGVPEDLYRLVRESAQVCAFAAHGLDRDEYDFPDVATWAGTSDDGHYMLDVVATAVLSQTRELVAAMHAADPGMAPRGGVVTTVAQRSQAPGPNAATLDVAARAAAGAQRTASLRQRAEGAAARTRPGVNDSQVAAAPQQLLAINALAASFFRQQLKAHEGPRGYLTGHGSWNAPGFQGRGFTEATIARFGVGYAPAGWTQLTEHLRSRGYRDEELVAAGVAVPSRRGGVVDLFRDRIMFPVRRVEDEAVIAFIGRAAPRAGDDVPKYINSPDTALYTKGEHLFGLSEGRSHLDRGAYPVLVEGPMDAMAVSNAGDGLWVGVAPGGTSLTSAQVEALTKCVDVTKRYPIAAFDDDAAGRKAAIAAFEVLRVHDVQAMRAELPEGSDPADVLERYGFGMLAVALTGADDRPLADWVVDAQIEPWAGRLDEVLASHNAAKAAAEVISTLPREQVWRQTNRVAQRLHQPQQYVIGLVGDALADRDNARTGGGASARVAARDRGDDLERGQLGDAFDAVAISPAVAGTPPRQSEPIPAPSSAAELAARGQLPLAGSRRASAADPHHPPTQHAAPPLAQPARSR
ncbi:hypothetical protein NUM3379_34960 [Kineococcus sp. NUM-3379]